MYTRRSLIGAAVGAALTPGFAHASTASPGSGNPGLIFGPGPDGRCDDAKNGGSVIQWNEADGRWWMWYYCRSKRFPKGIAPAFGTGSIALAKSKDGIRWERHDGHLAEGAIMTPSEDPEAFDSQHIGTGQVIRQDGRWVLFYFGGNLSAPPPEIGGQPVAEGYQIKGYLCRPGIATSDDGIRWTRVAGKGPGGAAVDIGEHIYGAFPSGVHDGERYLMYYSALMPRPFYWATRIAASSNLVDWEDLGEMRWSEPERPWQLGGIVTRQVIPNPLSDLPGRFLQIYAGMDSRFPRYPRKIGAATSDDGLVWRSVEMEPILHPGPIRQWDSGGVSYGQLVPVGDKLHLYFYGYADQSNPLPPGRGVGLAISASGKLGDFRRIPGLI